MSRSRVQFAAAKKAILTQTTDNTSIYDSVEPVEYAVLLLSGRCWEDEDHQGAQFSGDAIRSSSSAEALKEVTMANLGSAPSPTGVHQQTDMWVATGSVDFVHTPGQQPKRNFDHKKHGDQCFCGRDIESQCSCNHLEFPILSGKSNKRT